MKSIKCILFAVIFSLISTASLWSISAIPTPVEITQPDGTKLTIRINGDERFGYRTTLDGYLLLQDDQGFLCYARQVNDKIIPGLKASDIENRSEAENNQINGINKVSLIDSYKSKANLSLRNTKEIDHRTNQFPATGSPRSLVVLVEFQDIRFNSGTANSNFTAMLNQQGYNLNGATGSAKDYFSDTSNGLFTPQFDVYGPVLLPNNVVYYGADYGDWVDYNAQQMIIDACLALEGSVDFSLYDEDGDGEIDNVFVFYAGYGQATGGSDDTIWPHKSSVYGDYYVDGLELGPYACANELTIQNRMVGIGTFVHEFCHVIGLPDLYDTNYSGAPHPESYSVLASGPYNNNSNTPPTMSAYERYSMGWLEPEELTVASSIALDNIFENKAYIIKTDSENEFFMLENRQRTSWDTYLPEHGMLIWHIDYDRMSWRRNTVNNDVNHQRVEIEKAGNSSSNRVFPGSGNVRNFTDDTAPNMRTWSGTSLNKPVTGIREEGGKIYFKFKGGILLNEKVNAKEAQNITYQSFSAQWDIKSNASGYILDVYKKDGENIIYVNGYEYLVLSDNSTTSQNVYGLDAEQQYFYTVKAIIDGAETIPSDEIEVTTAQLPFHLNSPLALEASGRTENSFIANWEPMDDATSYEIDVYERSSSIQTSSMDFSDGISDRENTNNWSLNPEFHSYEETGFYGTSAPSALVQGNDTYIKTSRHMGAEIKSLSFWYNSTNGKVNSETYIEIYGTQGHDLGPIYDKYVLVTGGTVNPVNTNGGNVFNLDLNGGYKRLRISFHCGNESIAIDDIAIAYDEGVVINPIPAYTDLNVGNVTSFTVNGLDPNTEYGYTITGVQNDLSSQISNEIIVITNISAGIQDQNKNNEPLFTIIDNTVYVLVENAKVEIYNMQGQMLVNTVSQGTGIQLYPGVFVLRIDGSTYKILIK